MPDIKNTKGPGEGAAAQSFPGDRFIRLATAFVPPQRFRESFNLSEALRKGTLFPELYWPYRHRELV